MKKYTFVLLFLSVFLFCTEALAWFKLCNEHHEPISTAVIMSEKVNNKTRMRVRGWYNIEPRKCSLIATEDLIFRYFYVFASSKTLLWNGNFAGCTSNSQFVGCASLKGFIAAYKFTKVDCREYQHCKVTFRSDTKDASQNLRQSKSFMFGGTGVPSTENVKQRVQRECADKFGTRSQENIVVTIKKKNKERCRQPNNRRGGGGGSTIAVWDVGSCHYMISYECRLSNKKTAGTITTTPEGELTRVVLLKRREQEIRRRDQERLRRERLSQKRREERLRRIAVAKAKREQQAYNAQKKEILDRSRRRMQAMDRMSKAIDTNKLASGVHQSMKSIKKKLLKFSWHLNMILPGYLSMEKDEGFLLGGQLDLRFFLWYTRSSRGNYGLGIRAYTYGGGLYSTESKEGYPWVGGGVEAEQIFFRYFAVGLYLDLTYSKVVAYDGLNAAVGPSFYILFANNTRSEFRLFFHYNLTSASYSLNTGLLGRAGVLTYNLSIRYNGESSHYGVFIHFGVGGGKG